MSNYSYSGKYFDELQRGKPKANNALFEDIFYREGSYLRGRSLHQQSDGESLLSVFEHRFSREESHVRGISVHQQSHGESLFSVFEHSVFQEGSYLRDKPEAALSPQRLSSYLPMPVPMPEPIGRMEIVLAGGERVIVGADVDERALTRVVRALSRR